MSILLSARQNILFIDCPPGVTSSPRPQSAEEMESGTSLCPSCTWNTGRKRGIHTGPLASSRPQGAAGGISQHCSPHSSLSEEKLERNFPKCLSHHQEEITAFLPLSSLAAAPKHGLPLRCVCVGGVSAVWKTSAAQGPSGQSSSASARSPRSPSGLELPQQGLPGVTSSLSLPAKHARVTRRGRSTSVPSTIPGRGFLSSEPTPVPLPPPPSHTPLLPAGPGCPPGGQTRKVQHPTGSLPSKWV